MHQTLPLLNSAASEFPAIRRGALQTLQVNVGYRCNQSCTHCHVNAGPKRTEMMDEAIAREVIAFLQRSGVRILDITGGAPELNANFRSMVTQARRLGTHVIDRCNLTVLQEPEQEDLADFLAENNVEVIASLPCYLEQNVDAQRGPGIFTKSIDGLKRLNALGYGRPDSDLVLNLMYNPAGPYLPPAQKGLEQDYRTTLEHRYGVHFSNLYTLVNMPIQRFGSTLVSKGTFDDYLQLLRDAYQPANLQRVMCRSLISVDWRGYVYDCDFNQMLDIPLPSSPAGRTHISQLDGDDMCGRPIAVADHCWGCTAGQGSSCGGALG
ncbi:MAG: radical SAM protein [Gammaproteobacteria bacterium SG8_47]|nr:MAG: radical SAM protein [Gammaproteobacteria bacterium SG8_47]